MADEIKNRFGAKAELIEGSGGVFDVTVNGKLIYSKHETGEFPDHAKLLDAMASYA
ncbi:MAG: Rdx family protein [Phycisphaerales bacterium]|nr:Rdx family protein [Phycisphaerales bacterium]